MSIRLARPDDVPACRDIERAAGEAFRDIGMPEIANDEPLPADELLRYQQAGRAWVAVDGRDRPVAYLIAEPIDGNLHIEQVSVHHDHARRGIGRSLLEHLAAVAEDGGFPAPNPHHLRRRAVELARLRAVRLSKPRRRGDDARPAKDSRSGNCPWPRPLATRLHAP